MSFQGAIDMSLRKFSFDELSALKIGEALNFNTTTDVVNLAP